MIRLPSLASAQTTALKLAMLAALLLASHLAAYQHGRHVVEGEKAAAERDIAIAYAGEIVARQAAADQLAAENQQIRTAKASKDRLITQEIARYVEVTPSTDRCALPGTWRLRHDAAATGAPLAEAGPMDARSAAPVEDAAVLDTVGDNYEACRDTADKLIAWQRRYQELEADREKTD